MYRVTLVVLFYILILGMAEIFGMPPKEAYQSYLEEDFASSIAVCRPIAEDKGFMSVFNSESGVTACQTLMGHLYSDGHGVPQDDKTAREWYKIAADQGHPTAQYNLGYAYHRGFGVARNYETALKWYSLSNKAGDEKAPFQTAMIHLWREDAPEDWSSANEMLMLSADRGYTAAYCQLGRLWSNGEKGFPKDTQKGFAYTKLAAELEDSSPECQFALSLSYYHGIGTEKDLMYAYMWMYIADSNAADLTKEYKEYLRTLETEITPSDVLLFKQLGDACLKQKRRECDAIEYL